MAADEVLSRERILEAAEDALRRFGPQKATVVDVARALNVSHGSVYRHFASKAALRDAVAERWLARVSAPLEAIAQDKGPADLRLRQWFDRLIEAKHRKVLDDPELFETYHRIAMDAREVVIAHVDHLLDQLTRIIADGAAQGLFKTADPAATARAVLDATTRFHKPTHAGEWRDPGIMAAFDGVWKLVLAGLKAG